MVGTIHKYQSNALFYFIFLSQCLLTNLRSNVLCNANKLKFATIEIVIVITDGKRFVRNVRQD